ncbi:MAG: hypothetical protein ACP5FH_05600 [Terracidiphilus sp.]
MDKMEIGPVTGVRIVPTVKPKEADLGSMDVDRVESSARMGDETYLPSKARAATGDDEENDELDESEKDPETGTRTAQQSKPQINYFA